MPSVNPTDSFQPNDIDTCEHVLFDFKEKIAQCLSSEDWDQLPIILRSRQAYLEQIFSQPIPDDLRDNLKSMMQALLIDDASFLAQVEEHKSGLVKQQLSFDRGLRATQAYKNS
jgi:hypothetical protein